MSRSAHTTLLILGCMLLNPGAHSVAEAAQGEDTHVVEILRSAKPAPNPPGPVYSHLDSASPEFLQIVAYDPATGEQRLETRSTEPVDPFAAGFPGSVAPNGSPLLMGGDHADLFSGKAPSATPPSPLSNTTTYPFNTIYKMLMRFNVGGNDYYYLCSAWAADSFHAVTAGHCIYNWDPNGDGSDSDKKWADEVWLWPAQTDRVNPFGGDWLAADHPYGVAKMVTMRTYTGWVNSQDYNHDWGVITLDRRIGDRIGWMGRESSVASSLNFSGYPTETPYVPGNTHVQYYGYDDNNVTFPGIYRIYLEAYIYGGHSGGPSWRYDAGSRWVEGIHSTSNRTGSATDTRLTGGKLSDLNSYISDDQTSYPPQARPEMEEYLFDGVAHKGFSPTSVGKLDSIDVDWAILNTGFADTGTLTVDFYASNNNVISEFDTLLGSATWSNVAQWTYVADAESVTVPTSLEAGTWWVGWIASCANAEYAGDLQCSGAPCSNHAIIADQTLTVQDCTLDGYEPDGSSGQANALYSGSPQSHSLCSIGDEDWYTFTITETSEVVLETSGASGDTRMWLYNSSLGEIEYSDDEGSGSFSLIDRLCGVDELPAGTYYVLIDESGDNNYIPDYGMSLTATACPVVDLIFADGFEAADTSAWTVAVP